MSYENKFLNLAVRESNLPNGSRVSELAEVKMMGSIGLVAESRDDFIRAGIEFVEKFEASATETIAYMKEDTDYCNNEVVEEIGNLVAQSKQVSFGKLFDLLGNDWDEREAD